MIISHLLNGDNKNPQKDPRIKTITCNAKTKK